MIAITIDCEQWNSAEIRGKKDKFNNNTLWSRKGNERLLEIFESHKVKATFFVTGYFAEKEKQQVKEISRKHEVACHGYNNFYRGNKNLDLKNDIIKSKKILENITRKKITGFRAPQMQFSEELVEILGSLGFKYDSSIHPAYLPGFYNHRDKPIKPFKIGKILEIPAAVSPKLRLPVSWIFMRNLPLTYSVRIIKKLIKNNIVPVIYVHSWEFDKVENKNTPFYITRNTGEKFCRKLDRLLNKFKDEKFVTLSEIK